MFLSTDSSTRLAREPSQAGAVATAQSRPQPSLVGRGMPVIKGESSLQTLVGGTESPRPPLSMTPHLPNSSPKRNQNPIPESTFPKGYSLNGAGSRKLGGQEGSLIYRCPFFSSYLLRKKRGDRKERALAFPSTIPTKDFRFFGVQIGKAGENSSNSLQQ